jgi:GTPase
VTFANARAQLKLIDPCSERFERLVTQMKWRLSQGGNEAIYEIGLAGELRSPLSDLTDH